MRFLIPIFCLAGSAFGASILSNIGAANGGQNNLFGVNAFAAGFTVNGGSNLSLDLAQVTLNNSSASAIAASSLNLGLFASSGGVPVGSALATFTLGSSIASGINAYNATPNSAFQLTAGTTYWLVLNAPNLAGSLFWESAANNTFATGAGATYAGSRFGTMSSATQVNSFGATNGSPLIFEIDASIVTGGGGGNAPEPATFGLAGAALSGLMIIRQRRGGDRARHGRSSRYE